MRIKQSIGIAWAIISTVLLVIVLRWGGLRFLAGLIIGMVVMAVVLLSKNYYIKQYTRFLTGEEDIRRFWR